MASSKVKSSDLSSSSAAASASTRSKRASALSSSATATTATSSSSSSPSLSIKDQIQSINYNLTTSLSPASTMTVDGILRNVYSTPSAESTLLDAQITLIDSPTPTLPTPPPAAGAAIETNHIISSSNNQEMNSSLPQGSKTVDDVWREIVAGRKEMKEEPDEMMTLEDFLAKAGAVDEGEEDEVKMPPPERLSGGIYAFDAVPPGAFQVLDKLEGSIVGFGNGVEMVAGGGSGVGRGKRGRTTLMEPLDKAAQQRQRRMIKNRESAARSRERKQAYQVELESLAVRLEEENDRLDREKKERTRERRRQLSEKVVPVVEKRRPRRTLRRVQSLQW